MQDIKSRELRNRRTNVNTRICFKVRATALRPRLHTEDFHYVHTGPSTKGPQPRNYNDINKKYTTPTLNHLYTRVKACNAPIPRVWRRYCEVYRQGENTLTYIH